MRQLCACDTVYICEHAPVWVLASGDPCTPAEMEEDDGPVGKDGWTREDLPVEGGIGREA